MTALKNCSAELRNYLFSHKLPEVFEALLTGLAIECPPDACEFVVRKLSLINSESSAYECLRWDSFISAEKRPKEHLLKGLKRNLGEVLWCYEDENSQPTPEMYQRAYSLYNYKLKHVCLKAWMSYHAWKRQQQETLLAEMKQARRYHRMRNLRVYFMAYLGGKPEYPREPTKLYLHELIKPTGNNLNKKWYRQLKNLQIEISTKIRKVVKMSLLRMVFVGWRAVVVDSKKTREYFEKIERGEVFDAGEYGKDFFESKDGNDVISSLPKHIALLIFSNVDIEDLGKCSKVSRSWKLIIQSSLLWSKMDFTNMRSRLTNKITSRLVHRYRSVLVHLNLRGCCELTQGGFRIIGESKNLQDLNVSECIGINDDVIKGIAAGCSSLLYLNLSRCNISDATLRSLSRNCVNLQYLSMSGCHGFTDKGLSYLTNSKGARKLSYLDISGCEQITEQGFVSISSGFLSLATLILNDLPSLGDEKLQMLDKCTSIKTISILNSPLISDTGLKYLITSRRLQKIQIEGNNRITDSAIKALTKSCPELRHVYIADCARLTDLSLKALASCKHLIVLNIADCVRIQDAGVRQIVEGPSGAKLREINLTNCVRVSDVTLLRIAQRCHNLTYCSVCYCEHVTDAGLELLATLPSLVSLDVSGCNVQDHGVSSLGNSSKLRDVTLSDCRNITDLGLQKMFQQCRYLENLDLSYCTKITDYAIKNLAFCCRLLRTLNLAGCKKLSDSSVQYLAGVCHYIEHLNLSECVLLTDRSLRFVRKGLKHLKSLDILYCCDITKASVKKLMVRCKQIRHTNQEAPSAVLVNPFINPKRDDYNPPLLMT